MNLFERCFFNLFVNGTCSFWAGCLFVALVLRFFRIPQGRWTLYFLSLPFAKILWDLAQGIPRTSYLFSDINPFFVPKHHSLFKVGVGASQWGPILSFDFAVKGRDGLEYSVSLADYFAEALRLKFSKHAPAFFIFFAVALAAFFLARRAIEAWHFERERACFRRLAETLPARRVAGRTVDVFVSDAYEGTPFTGGLVRPYVCFPQNTWRALGPEEREAVLEHELSHVRNFDLFWNLAIQLLGDLFWFVPGYRFLCRKLERLRELLADRLAVKRGTSPVSLASALVKLKEVEQGARTPVLYSALVKERSLLKLRVERLLNSPETTEPVAAPRFGWGVAGLRWLLAAWVTGGVLLCRVGGNYEVDRFPEWLERWLRMWGLR